MRNLQQRVNVVEVYLPEPEDVDGFGVKGGEIDGVALESEEDVVVAARLGPRLTDCSFEGMRKG